MYYTLIWYCDSKGIWINKTNRDNSNTVRGILRKIEEKAASGGYIYRGEPEHYQEAPYYGRVSSNFYRAFLIDNDFDVEAEAFDIEAFQEIMLTLVLRFSREQASEIERLAVEQILLISQRIILLPFSWLVMGSFWKWKGYFRKKGRAKSVHCGILRTQEPRYRPEEYIRSTSRGFHSTKSGRCYQYPERAQKTYIGVFAKFSRYSCGNDL